MRSFEEEETTSGRDCFTLWEKKMRVERVFIVKM